MVKKRISIKNIQAKSTVIFTVLSLLMSCLLIALCMQYKFFCEQAKNMIELRDQYKLCMVQVRKILEKDSQVYMSLSGEHSDQLPTDTSIFPQGAHVVSSGDKQIAVGDSLLLINREPEYLKKSMVSYLKQECLDPLLSRIDLREWKDHTDCNITDMNQQQIVRRPLCKNSYSVARKKRQLKKGQTFNSNSFFMWPIVQDNFWISSRFGKRKSPNGVWKMHNGIDMAALKGTPVKASAAGVVVESRYVSGYGNTIVLAHNKKYKTRCAHLDTIRVKIGQKIDKGKVIGTVGDTGFIRKIGKDGSHLHFEIYEYGKRVNPLSLLPSLV